MTSQQPRVTIAKPVRANGVLSVPASATQREPRQSSGNSLPKTSPASATRQKILVRRLPPGLTQVEFEEALGDEWRPGGDRVGWAHYKPGKASRDPAKPSRPSRAYLYVKKAEHVGALGDKVRATTFNDAKHSGNDSCLLGPPSAEFAPFQKIPNSRARKDARQSTIDQDPEFIDFLESLTIPITKSSSVDHDGDSAKNREKPTVTPLIQFLKEKKANKGKEASSSTKGGKHGRQDSKGSKSTVNANSKTAPVVTSPSTKKRSAQAVKVEQAARDAVKVLSKQPAITKSPASPAPSTSNAKAPSSNVTPNVTPNSTATAALADKKRERGNASAAAKILQRDLGLAGSPAGRGGRGARGSRSSVATAAASTSQQTAAKTEQSTTQATSQLKENVNTPKTPVTAPTESTSASAVNSASSTPTTASTSPAQKPKSPPSGPAASRTNPPTHPRNAHHSKSGSTAQTPPSNSTQAFLKHANPSQGITEALLSTTFAPFGTLKKCEIDKKKGFAYIDFESPEGLQKAIKASPVKVAQGQVVVLERKIGGREQPGRNIGHGGGGGSGRGGHVGARGGGNVRGRGSGVSRGGAANAPIAPRAASTAPSLVSPSLSTAAPTSPSKTAAVITPSSSSVTLTPMSEV